MASRQFIEERIRKAEENISKKQGTISRKQTLITKKEDQIRKLGFEPAEAVHMGWSSDEKQNKATWLASDIENLEDDIKRLHEEVADLQKKLEGYKQELQVIIEKENSRNIQVILDFLEWWKQEVKDFYQGKTEDWITTLQDYYDEDRKFCEWKNMNFKERKNKELMKQMGKPAEDAKKRHELFNFLTPYMERTGNTYQINMDKLQKNLDQEANRKYDFIIERTNQIVGQITDASNLTVGDKGDLNGYIIGTKGTAKVQTIGAGGYNIQCFHFRTLINRMN